MRRRQQFGMATLVATAVLLGSLTSPAQAGFQDTVTLGVLNTYQDSSQESSREAVFYQNPAAGLQVGDVVIGFNQINTNATPGGPAVTPNTFYAIFAEQITSITNGGTRINFGAVVQDATVVGGVARSTLALSALTGLSIPANSVASFFDRPNASPFPVDLLTTGSLAGLGSPPITNMMTAIRNVSNTGTYNMSFGFGSPPAGAGPDFSHWDLGTVAGVQLTAATATAGELNSLSDGITFADSAAGLSLTQNNTSLNFGLDNNVGQDGLKHQFVLSAGVERGANNLPNFGLLGGGAAGVNTPMTATSGSASFQFAPTAPAATAAPEPASLTLLGLGALGLLGYGWRRRQQAA